MTGYSTAPLQKKLGIKENSVAHFLHPPEHYLDLISPIPINVNIKKSLSGEFDFIHLFSTDNKDFMVEFVRCKKHLNKTGMLWVSWPKKASKVPTDLDENRVREFGLKTGLVDVKICAVDEVWSGLKFVFRLKDR